MKFIYDHTADLNKIRQFTYISQYNCGISSNIRQAIGDASITATVCVMISSAWPM